MNPSIGICYNSRLWIWNNLSLWWHRCRFLSRCRDASSWPKAAVPYRGIITQSQQELWLLPRAEPQENQVWKHPASCWHLPPLYNERQCILLPAPSTAANKEPVIKLTLLEPNYSSLLFISLLHGVCQFFFHKFTWHLNPFHCESKNSFDTLP